MPSVRNFGQPLKEARQAMKESGIAVESDYTTPGACEGVTIIDRLQEQLPGPDTLKHARNGTTLGLNVSGETFRNL